jgi:hypothetical protein
MMVRPGPGFSVIDVHHGWTEALRELGQDVAEYRLDDRITFYGSALIETGTKDADGRPQIKRALSDDQAAQLAVNGLLSACYQFWPDVVVFVSAFLIPADVLDLVRSRGHRVVILCTEQPYELKRELDLAARADLILLNDPTHLEAFQALTKAAYVPHAYRPALHHPGPPTPELTCDLSFVGTGYPSRVEFLEAMDLDGVDVLLAGNWQLVEEGSKLHPFLAHGPDECLDNAKTVEVYRSTQVGLNLYRREAMDPDHVEGWSMGPREVEMAACGLFFLRDPRPEGDEIFPSLPTFTSPSEASEQLRWWLAHPSERAEAALKAREAIADRTFAHHAAALLRQLDQ